MLPHLAHPKRHPDADPRSWSRRYATTYTPATTNLKLYLSLARLPFMHLGPCAPSVPPDGHKSHRNNLSVRAEDWRKLREMGVLSSGDFDTATIEFIQKYIPSHDLGVCDPDNMTGERLTVPCSPVFRITDETKGLASTMYSVVRYVVDYPLATLQRILHLTFPHTQEWYFSPVMAEPDDDIVSCVTWDRRNPDRTVDTAVVVMIQPPWIASAADLQAFVECQRLPQPNIDPNTGENLNEFSSKERMWAKLWDYSARKKCHYFVVTTYWGWVFGAFSRGRTKGYVIPAIPHDSIRPTILEYLTFHFASAMGIDDGWDVPEVAEPVSDVNLGVEDSAIPPIPFGNLYHPPPSESAWEATSDANVDAVSTMDTEEAVQMLLSPTGVQNSAILPPAIPASLEEKMMEWQMTGVPLSPTSSEISSAVTVSSGASTSRDQGPASGDWLTERPY